MLLHLVASVLAFDGGAKYERWAHFKYVGIPHEAATDALATAAIADGACRLISPDFDGFALWRQPLKATAVISALSNVPHSADDALGRPSNFTLTTQKVLQAPCAAVGTGEPPAPTTNFTLEQIAKSVQNWYHALCAPASDPTWAVHGYDPAYQPQQQAITTGLACIAACDVAGLALPASAMSATYGAPSAARDAMCAAFPWAAGSATLFSAASSRSQLAASLKPILHEPCGCASGDEGHKAWLVAACVVVGCALVVALLVVWSRRRSRRQSDSETATDHGGRSLWNQLMG